VSQTLMMAASRKPVVMAPLTELSGCMKRTPLFFGGQCTSES